MTSFLVPCKVVMAGQFDCVREYIVFLGAAARRNRKGEVGSEASHALEQTGRGVSLCFCGHSECRDFLKKTEAT